MEGRYFECGPCGQPFCGPHSGDPTSKLGHQCAHCTEKFCDRCMAFYDCIYCRDSVCVVSSSLAHFQKKVYMTNNLKSVACPNSYVESALMVHVPSV